MAIVLKYGSPGPILQAGFAAGVGKRKKDQQEDLLKIWQQQTQQGFQAQQSLLDRQQRAGLQENALNFQADENARNLNFRYQQQAFQTEQDKLQREFQAGQLDKTLGARVKESEMARLQREKHYEDLKYQNTLKGLATGDFELPNSAQTELKKLEEGRVLMQGPDWTDQQRAQFDADYQAKKRALYGLAEPSRQMTPQEEFQKSTFEKDGTTYQRTDRGFQVLKEPPDYTKQNEKIQSEFIKRQEKFQADTARYQKEIRTEALRLQKEGEGIDGKVQPLDSYVDQAKKNLSLFDITEPQAPSAEMSPLLEAPNEHAQPQPSEEYSGYYSEDYIADDGSVRTAGRRAKLLPQTQQAPTAPTTATPGQESTETDAQFNAKWAILKPGQSMVGPDGTIWIKKRTQ